MSAPLSTVALHNQIALSGLVSVTDAVLGSFMFTAIFVGGFYIFKVFLSSLSSFFSLFSFFIFIFIFVFFIFVFFFPFFLFFFQKTGETAADQGPP